MRVTVRLMPRASSDDIDGWGADDKGRPVLKVRVRAAPIDGKANAALIACLAKALDVPKSRITLVGGETARLKTLDVEGLEHFPKSVTHFSD